MAVTESNPAGQAPTNNLGGYATTFAQDKGVTVTTAYASKNSWDTAVKSLVSSYSYESELSSLYSAYQDLQKNSVYKPLLKKLLDNKPLTRGENSLHDSIIRNRLSIYYYTKSKEYTVYIINSLAAKIQQHAGSLPTAYPLRGVNDIIGDKSPRVDRIIDSINFVRFTKTEKDRHDLSIRVIYNRIKTELWDSGKKDDYASYVVGLGINYPYK